MSLQNGNKAPSFKLTDQNGEVHSLEDYKGQWVVLYFYPKDDTPGCTTEACSFRDIMEELNKSAVVLGVSADTVESHKQFVEKYHLNFTLLADPDQEVIKAYDVSGGDMAKRTTFIISPEQMIQKVFENVDPQQHAQEILSDILKFQSNQTKTSFTA